MSASDRLPVGNSQNARKPGAGKTAWLTTISGEGTPMLCLARNVQAADAATYVNAFAITDEDFARIRSPQQA